MGLPGSSPSRRVVQIAPILFGLGPKSGSCEATARFLVKLQTRFGAICTEWCDRVDSALNLTLVEAAPSCPAFLQLPTRLSPSRVWTHSVFVASVPPCPSSHPPDERSTMLFWCGMASRNAACCRMVWRNTFTRMPYCVTQSNLLEQHPTSFMACRPVVESSQCSFNAWMHMCELRTLIHMTRICMPLFRADNESWADWCGEQPMPS